MSDFIRHPFAATGEREAIPDSTQVDGSVSLQEGFGPEYSLDIRTEAEARSIERTKFNFLMYRVTSAIRWLQMFGVPEFISTSDNGGTAFSYADGVRVRYNPGSGYKVYQSLAANNTALPTDATKWIEVHTASGVPNGTITNAQIKADAAIDATKIGGGTVSNAVFGYLA